MHIHIDNTQQLDTFVRNVAKHTKLSPTRLKSAIAKSVGYEHIKPLETALDISFNTNIEQTPTRPQNTLVLSHVYIEDVTPAVLKVLIQSNPELKFKHRDCAMYFTSDGDHLYASDVDGNASINEQLNDCFYDGRFVTTIYDHYRDHAAVITLLTSLSEVGLDLSLSDHLQNHEMELTAYKAQIEN